MIKDDLLTNYFSIEFSGQHNLSSCKGRRKTFTNNIA